MIISSLLLPTKFLQITKPPLKHPMGLFSVNNILKIYNTHLHLYITLLATQGAFKSVFQVCPQQFCGTARISII